MFHDYESYVAKFQNNGKTTDDTYTPRDVYEAVLQYVGEITDLTGKSILRPFYPGGDYENAEYPEDGVVIDNPPFSMFTEIVKFYSSLGIPFFLFGPGLTIMSVVAYCTVVIVSDQITFDNGAKVNCNFATNLMGDVAATTSVRLSRLLRQCPSQDAKVNLPKFQYPLEVVSASDFQTIARGDEDFSLLRSECLLIRKLGCGRKLFGNHLLTTSELGKAKEKAKEKAKNVQVLALSEKEKRICKYLRTC